MSSSHRTNWTRVSSKVLVLVCVFRCTSAGVLKAVRAAGVTTLPWSRTTLCSPPDPAGRSCANGPCFTEVRNASLKHSTIATTDICHLTGSLYCRSEGVWMFTHQWCFRWEQRDGSDRRLSVRPALRDQSGSCWTLSGSGQKRQTGRSGKAIIPSGSNREVKRWTLSVTSCINMNELITHSCALWTL